MKITCGECSCWRPKDSRFPRDLELCSKLDVFKRKSDSCDEGTHSNSLVQNFIDGMLKR